MYSNLPLIISFVLLLSFLLAVRAGIKRGSKKELLKDAVYYDNVVLLVRVPRFNTRDALSAEQLFASLHGLLRITPQEQEHISFEINSSASGMSFHVIVPLTLKDFVVGQLYSQYPDATIHVVNDYTKNVDFKGKHIKAGEIKLEHDQIFPIKSFRAFDVDPLAAITGAMSEIPSGDHIWWQLIVRPIADIWQEAGHEYVAQKRGKKVAIIGFSVLISNIAEGMLTEVKNIFVTLVLGFMGQQRKVEEEKKEKEKPELPPVESERLKMIETKLGKLGFQVQMRVFTVSKDPLLAESYLRRVLASFKQFAQVGLNSFTPIETEEVSKFLKLYVNRGFELEKSYVLTTEELASIYHFPNESVETPSINWSPSKLAEPPAGLPTTDCTYLGRTTFREKEIPFGIKTPDRRQHMYLIGKTGTGKSTIFKNMIKQDMEQGKGIGIIDPHGQLIDEVLEFIPDHRVKDVVILDPSDIERPVSINLLESSDPSMNNLLASGLLGAFKKNFEYSWGPRLEYLLNNTILTMVAIDRTTMLGLTRLLLDKNYRKYITHKIDDPVLKDFWENEYNEIQGNARLATEAIAPIQNKVNRFLASSTLRHILGQAHSSVKMEEIMNEEKILLINLAKGRIGEDNSNLLGSLLVSRLNFAAMQRVNIPEEERKDFYLYVDEFQNFASGEFASILSEARKYRLSLNLTHQYTAQLPEELLDAILGNVGTIVALTLGAEDAAVIAREFAPTIETNDLISLEKYQYYISLLINNTSSLPFSASSFPPPSIGTNNKEKVIQNSKEVYGRDGKMVAEYIQRWVERDFTLGLAKAEEAREAEK